MAGDLTENFSRSEFMSPDGAPLPSSLEGNLQELADNLQVLRDAIGKPIAIHSGYRSPAHNTAIGGASRSKHMEAMAADFSVGGATLASTYCLIEYLIKQGDMKQGGLGIYSAHLHYDIRGQKVRWNKDALVPDCRPIEPPAPKEEDMLYIIPNPENEGQKWLTDGVNGKRLLTSPAAVESWKRRGAKEDELSQDEFEAIPILGGKLHN